MIDRSTGTSLGYGFVKYHSSEAAAAARTAMREFPVDGKRLKVSVARPSSREIQKANVYCSGLPLHYTADDLRALFAGFGTIIDTRVLTNPASGEARGVGFVRFNTHKEAASAIQAIHGSFVPEASGANSLLVAKFAESTEDKINKRRRKSADGSTLSQSSRSSSEASVAAITSTLAKATIMLAPVTSDLSSKASSEASTGTNMSSNISSATSPGMARPIQRTFVPLFVCQLPPNTTESLLYNLFVPFGTVSSIKVIRDKGRAQCKGYGFVNMAHLDEAFRAVEAVNGFVLEGRKMTVAFKHDAQRVEAEAVVYPGRTPSPSASSTLASSDSAVQVPPTMAGVHSSSSIQSNPAMDGGSPPLPHSVLANMNPEALNSLYATAEAIQAQQQQYLQFSASMAAAAGLLNPNAYTMGALPYATQLPTGPFVGGYPLAMNHQQMRFAMPQYGYNVALANAAAAAGAPHVTLSTAHPSSPKAAMSEQPLESPKSSNSDS